MISEVKTNTQIFRTFYLRDLIIVAVFAGFGYITREMVNQGSVLAYLVFNVIVGIILVLPCPFTHRKIYTFLIHSLIRNRTTYHSTWEMPETTLTNAL